ncbi:MAG: glycosyltransferase [Pseudomonadota bacterium]
MNSSLGVVVIGRNEGERLRKCLASITTEHRPRIVVYVDSGSTDGSVEFARSLGCHVVELDLRTAFTAARARNQGVAYALGVFPDLESVQFVDGDCELLPDWLSLAQTALRSNPAAAAVCGRLRERYPEKSIYNQLCDIEWNTPVGNVKACGGIALFRVAPFAASGGFREGLIAGEEPELCIRLRAVGWTILRISHDMALHDAAMLRFGQWWNRTKRCGYAFAEGSALHGAPPERHWVRETRSAWLWGAGIPILVAAMAVSISAWASALLLVYPLQVARLYWRVRHTSPRPGWHATFLVLGKLPEVLGQFKYLLDRTRGKRATLIEYK